MKIVSDNLPANIRRSVAEDLDEVLRLASPHGVTVPDRTLRLVSLENSSTPPGLPPHAVPVPSPQKPRTLAQRADWETRRQSFQIIETGDNTIWVIGGGAAGVLYGVGEVLRCLTGVIWAGVLEEDTLFGPRQPLPAGVQRPLIPYRVRDGYAPKNDFRAYFRWLSRNRWNAVVRFSAEWVNLPRQRTDELTDMLHARGMHLILGYHSMHHFLPDSEYERHPEWMGMRGGTRVRKMPAVLPDVPRLKAELPVQPCYSNPELAEFVTDRMAAHIAEFPRMEIFSLWPHDGINNWCQCPDCVRKTPYEHLYNLALRLAPKTRADLPIELIAYCNTLALPKHPLPHSDRIYGMFCPYLRRYWHRIYEKGVLPEPILGSRYPQPERANPVDEREYGVLFRRWLDVWRTCGSVPAVYDYAAGFYDETRATDRTRYFYHPRAEIRFDEARWYADQGVRVYYLWSLHEGWPDIFHHLAIPRAIWGQGSAQTLANDYYAALAGKDGARLREALSAVDRTLLAEGDPAEELAALNAVLDALPAAPYVERYRLWTRYVSLGWEARRAELVGDHERGMQLEQQIQKLFADVAETLDSHMPTRDLIGYSKCAEERFGQRAREAQ